MSIRAYYDVWCDGVGDGIEPGDCGQWAEGATTIEYEGRSVARRRARRAGWTYRRGIGDLCPRCEARYSAIGEQP